LPGSSAHILEQFIQDEAAALLQEEQGSFYPDNHHLIKPLVAKATKLLPPSQQVELYFHLLRLNECPPIKTEAEFDTLGAAYTRVLTLLDHGYPVCRLDRPKGLFLFGRDRQGSLAEEPVATHETYARHLAAWRYLDGFTNMPGMLSKKAKFAELGADLALVERVTRVLLRTDPVKELPSATCLWFWGMVLLALQTPASGGTVVDWLQQASAHTPDHRFFLENLVRFLRAAGRDELLPRLEAPLKALDDYTR
jgi:hypothetical protein